MEVESMRPYRFFILDRDDPDRYVGITGLICGRWNINVFIAIRALLILKHITPEEHEEVRQYFHEAEDQRDREIHKHRLLAEAQMHGYTLKPCAPCCDHQWFWARHETQEDHQYWICVICQAVDPNRPAPTEKHG
jgi:hypothetical protein